MNLIFICETVNFGVGNNVLDLIEYLLEKGHRILLIWSETRTGAQYRERIEKINDEKFDNIKFPMEREICIQDIANIFKLYSIIRSRGLKYEIVHGFSSKGGAYARIVGIFLGLKRFYSPHAYVMADPKMGTLKKSFYYNLERVLSFGAFVVCTSEEELALTSRMRLNRYKLIYNGIDTRKLKNDLSGSRKDKVCVAFVGRFSYQKNPQLYLRIVDKLNPDFFEFKMFGDGEMMPDVQLLARGLSVEVEICGQRALQEVLGSTDILLCTSRYEGFPYIFPQALAAGIPIVSTPVGGTEIIENEVDGFVFGPDQERDVQNFFKRIESSAGFLEKLSNCAEKKSALFEKSGMGGLTEAFYRSSL